MPSAPFKESANSCADLFSLPGISFHVSKADLPSLPSAPFKESANSCADLFSLPGISFHVSKADLPSAPFKESANSCADLFSLPGISFHVSKADLPSAPLSPLKEGSFLRLSLSRLTIFLLFSVVVFNPFWNSYNSLKIVPKLFLVTTSFPSKLNFPSLSTVNTFGVPLPNLILEKVGSFSMPIRNVPPSLNVIKLSDEYVAAFPEPYTVPDLP